MSAAGTDWGSLARSISLGTDPKMTILRERGGDVRIARTTHPAAGGVVVKLWNRPGLRGRLRRWGGSNPAGNEWRALVLLAAAGIPVPAPLAYLPRLPAPARHSEGLITLDLGVCGDVTEHLKGLIARGDGPGEERLTAEIVRVTTVMVHLGLLDTDHRLPNFVLTPAGTPVRLDFELLVRRPWPRWWWDSYGLMLGTLIGSYVFAVQPDRDRALAFAARLRRSLAPPRPVLRRAGQRVAAMLYRQELEIGLTPTIGELWGEEG